jgi:serine/threonine protein kinase
MCDFDKKDIQQHYWVHNVIGKGGNGSVYNCERIQDKKPFAIKKMEYISPASKQKIQDEALKLRELKHKYGQACQARASAICYS